jgi:translation initiation factor 6
MLLRMALAGNPNLGVYVRATEDHAFVPFNATKQELAQIREALEVEPIPLSIGGTRLVGSLMVANRHGIVVADLINPRERAILEATGLEILELADTLNAAGNTLLINDNGGVVAPDYPDEVVEAMSATLDIDLVRGTVAELVTVGMAAVANNRGVLVHPKSTTAERDVLRRALGVDVLPGTVNHGTGLIGAALAANSKGAAIGAATTGIEMGRIDEALGYLEAQQAR